MEEKKRNGGEERRKKWTGLGLELIWKNGKGGAKLGFAEAERRGEWSGGGEGEPLGSAELP